jgi:two-component system chemotaxis response regulator CheY
MKMLVVEDELTGRILLQEMLKEMGSCHVAINGKEAVAAVKLALNSGEPYELVLLDIMMPGMDGQEVLKRIRRMEEEKGIKSTFGAKIIMVTALGDIKNVSKAYGNLCDAYLVKPVEKAKLLEEIRRLGLKE